MTPSASSHRSAQDLRAFPRRSLHYNSSLSRNIFNRFLNLLAGVFASISVLPLLLVLAYVLLKGGRLIQPSLFSQLPPPPGSEGGGIGNAILGTVVVTALASLVAIPVGVGGGVYLAEFSNKGWFSQFVRFGNDVLAGVPSIISGVFVYGAIVATRIFLGRATAP